MRRLSHMRGTVLLAVRADEPAPGGLGRVRLTS